MTLDSLLCFYEKGSTCVHALVSMKKNKKLQKTSFIPEICFSLSPKLVQFNLSKSAESETFSFFISPFGKTVCILLWRCAVFRQASLCSPRS